MAAEGVQPARVLLVEANSRAATVIDQALRQRWGDTVSLTQVQNGQEAAEDLRERGASCVLLSLDSADPHALDALEQIHEAAPEVAVVVLAERADEDQAVAAIARGAQDYLVTQDLHPEILSRAVRFAVERKRWEVRLVQQALHDPLTGLPNRALFLDRLGVALDRSRRTGSSVAVLFVDVDDFKEVNDSMGHAAGDRLLAGLAERLITMLRPMDTIARFGGDEFVLLFEELSSEREVVLIADRISRAANVPVRVENGLASITVSIGVAVVRDPTISAETVIREADAAMYRAKQRGPSRYELFDEATRRRAATHLELEAELRAAIEEGQLRVHYQPEISLNTDEGVVGFEALVRWQHPDRGLILPVHFLALAEDTALIESIDELVLEDALRQSSRWREASPDLVVSVNVPGHRLEDASLIPTLARALQATGTDPAALRLEVTEKALRGEHDRALRTLSRLSALGVRLAVDDYGLGSFPLGTLAQSPIDTLKLDRNVVCTLGDGPAQTKLMTGLCQFAHTTGLAVVAEGVETDTELAALRSAGCDRAQGFLFSPAVPADEADALLGLGTRARLLRA